MYGAEQVDAQAGQELPVGIHHQLSDLAKRIAASCTLADKILDRVRGSQPSALSPDNKEATEPSTQQWIRGCHKAMARLENQLSELRATIS